MEQLPSELLEKIHKFDGSLSSMEDALKPYLKIPYADMKEKVADPLQVAKLELMIAYVVNSLFWGYLITQGVDAKAHLIKNELCRIRGYMAKLKELQHKKKMARIDTSAAKRFVRNALWEADQSKESEPTTGSSSSPTVVHSSDEDDTPQIVEAPQSIPTQSKKRKQNEEDNRDVPEKTKKKKKKKDKKKDSS